MDLKNPSVIAEKVDTVAGRSVPISASNFEQNSNDAEKSTDSLTYVKRKEMLVNEKLNVTTGESCRIKFDLRGSQKVCPNCGGEGCDQCVPPYSGYYPTFGYAKIYKNGSPIGLEREALGMSYTPFSQDFATTFVENDLIQIYMRKEESITPVYCRNMRICYGIEGTPSKRSMTTQDPE